MEFRFENEYDKKALMSLSKVARKTMRNGLSRVLGWVVIVLALIVAFVPLIMSGSMSGMSIATLIIAVALLVVLLSEDTLNAKTARRKLPPGTEKATAIFTEEGITSITGLGTVEFTYDQVMIPAETAGYFIFIYNKSQAQVYDKARMEGGTVEEFRQLIRDNVGKDIIPV